MNFLKNNYVRVLTAVLLLQGVVFYATASRPEDIPNVGALAGFPVTIAGWQMMKDVKIEQEVLDVLKADDTLNRIYRNPATASDVYLFIAFFKTQRYGQAPHSPKNCLPGSGWEPLESGPLQITVAGRPEPITTNRYLVTRGAEKTVVLYWYQSHSRVIASEYSAKFWLIADSIRFHRSDSSLVKVMVPVRNGDEQGAGKSAVEFVQAMFADLVKQLPT